MIRAIALDDEPPALRVLTHFCQQTPFVDLQRTFTRTDEARQYLADVGADLLFLDINMPFMAGTDFYRAISAEGGKPPMVVFTTAYAEYAVEGFALNAVDYLLKPFTYDRFLQVVTKASDYFRWQQRSSPTDDYLYVRADYTVYKIAFTSILFIEALDDYLKIHLEPGSGQGGNHPIVARMTMKNILEKLPGRSAGAVDSPRASTAPADRPGIDVANISFVRVHRSFIVPVHRIEGIRNKTIQLAGQSIPIGASYEKHLPDRF